MTDFFTAYIPFFVDEGSEARWEAPNQTHANLTVAKRLIAYFLTASDKRLEPSGIRLSNGVIALLLHSWSPLHVKKIVVKIALGQKIYS